MNLVVIYLENRPLLYVNRNTQNNRTAQIQQLLGTEGNAQGQGWLALNISADAVQDVPPCRIIQGKNLH